MSDVEDNAGGYNDPNEGAYYEDDEEHLAADNEVGFEATADAGEEQEQVDGEVIAAGETQYSGSSIP
jgi:hypothetical protein